MRATVHPAVIGQTPVEVSAVNEKVAVAAQTISWQSAVLSG